MQTARRIIMYVGNSKRWRWVGSLSNSTVTSLLTTTVAVMRRTREEKPHIAFTSPSAGCWLVCGVTHHHLRAACAHLFYPQTYFFVTAVRLYLSFVHRLSLGESHHFSSPFFPHFKRLFFCCSFCCFLACFVIVLLASVSNDVQKGFLKI